MFAPALFVGLLAAASPGAVELEGVAVTADGRPVDGAEVVLARSGRWPERPTLAGRCRSGPDGGYRIPLPADLSEPNWRRKHFSLWAWRPGGRAAVFAVPHYWPPRGEVVRLTLGVPAAVAVAVRGPDGRPVGGAKVTAAAARGEPLPDAVADALAVTTGPDGRATLTAFDGEDLDVVRVTAPDFGVQQLPLPRPGADGVNVLTLVATGRVEGRVTAGDVRAVRGLTLYLATRGDPSDDAGAGGRAEVTTDNGGRFAVPALAEGTLALTFRPHPELPFRGRFEGHPEVEAGRVTAVKVALKPAVRVTGEVREQGTEKPMAGVEVEIEWNAEAPRVRTDAQGRYAGYVLPGTVTAWVPAPPVPYFSPGRFLDTEPIPEGVHEFTLKKQLLVRGAAVRGRVVDESGRPLPGAEVTAKWSLPAGGTWVVSARADRDGNFALDGIDPKTEVRLTAAFRGTHTPRAEPATTGGKAVVLKLTAGGSVALAGRVVDPAGRPVAGAVVRLRSRGRDAEGFQSDLKVVSVEGRDDQRAGAEGRFRTPAWLDPELDYRADVAAPGFVSVRTEWLEPKASKSHAFADIILLPAPAVRTVEGRVVDRQGKPVAGAAVFQSGDGPRRTRCVSDAEGRFRLSGVYAGTAFLFAERDGFRFKGHRVEVNGRPVELVLDRTTDPAGPPLAALPQSLPRADERKLASRMLAPLLQRVDLKKVGAAEFRLIDIAPRVDPSFAMDFADRGALPAEYADYIRQAVAEGLADESPEEALAVAETSHGFWTRADAYLKVADTPGVSAVRKRELLDTALLYARREDNPLRRLDGLGYVARRLLELGETEAATKLLREGQAYAAGLPAANKNNRRGDGPHARGRFAAKLARIDPKAALELVAGFEYPYQDWYLAGVALGSSQCDPAEAERVIGRMQADNLRNLCLLRLAGRLAARDPARARSLLARVDDPNWRTTGLGNMARELAKTDPAAAGRLVDEALAAFTGLAAAGRASDVNYDSTCARAAALLPVAEACGPEYVERVFWRALALRPPRPARGSPPREIGQPGRGEFEPVVAQLAMMLARYDRATARLVLEPAAVRLRSLIDADRGGQHSPVLAAAAVIDPAWAVALLDALPDDPPGATLRPKDVARRTVADVLARGGPGLWEYLLQSYLYMRGDSRDDERI